MRTCYRLTRRSLALASAPAMLAALAGACSQAPKNLHTVDQIVPATLRVRGPKAPGADPDAGPGGTDYRSDPVPDERFDCDRPESLFAGVDLPAVRACLTAPASIGEVEYALKRDAVPYLELRKPKKAPACLRDRLSRIRMPREIVYRVSEGGCYSSRLDVEANQVLGVRLPIRRQAISVDLPVDEALETDEDAARLLAGWVLSFFWEQGSRTLRAKVVPEAICGRCMGVDRAQERKEKQDFRRWPW